MRERERERKENDDEKGEKFIQPCFWQNLVLVLKIGSHFQLQRQPWEMCEKSQPQFWVRKCWLSCYSQLWSPIIIKILRLTVKDDHPVTKLTSGPRLMGALIAFSSRQTWWRAMAQVCVFGVFSQTDGFNTASTWDSDGLRSLQGQRSASLNANCMCGFTHPKVAKQSFSGYLNWFLLKCSKNNQYLNNCESSSMCRNDHTNIWLKIERKDLYLQVKTAPLALLWDIQKLCKDELFTECSLQLFVSMGQSMWTSFLHLRSTTSLGVKCHQRKSSNVFFVGSVFPLCVVVIVLSLSSLPLLLSCRLFPGELVTHC